MTDFLSALSKTPVSIILIVAGLIFLAFAILQISINIRTVKAATPTSKRQILAGLVGAIMIVAGVYLSVKTGPPESPSATDTPMPASTQAAAIGTSQPGITTIPSLTPTLPSTPDMQTPQEFLNNYYAVLTDKKDYWEAWGLLTPKFQKAINPKGINDYISFWETIRHVDLNKIDVTWITAQSVNCQVEMTLRGVSGFTDSSAHSYFLVYNTTQRSWMFDIP